MGNCNNPQNSTAYRSAIDAINKTEETVEIDSFNDVDIFSDDNLVSARPLMTFSFFSTSLKTSIAIVNYACDFQSKKFSYFLHCEENTSTLFYTLKHSTENITNWIENRMERKEHILIPVIPITLFLKAYDNYQHFGYKMVVIEGKSLNGVSQQDQTIWKDFKYENKGDFFLFHPL